MNSLIKILRYSFHLGKKMITLIHLKFCNSSFVILIYNLVIFFIVSLGNEFKHKKNKFGIKNKLN